MSDKEDNDMGLFSSEDRSGEIAALRQQIRESDERKKKLATALTGARKRAEAAEIAVGKLEAELAEARRQVARMRQRQKASVARANRFRARLQAAPSQAYGS